MENPHRLIPDPSRSVNVNALPLEEPISTPTAVNKRKYKASTTSASSSLSSSESSSTPSSPVSDVSLEAGLSGERLMLRLPRRAQATKRPRLQLAQSGGGGVATSSVRARQTLAPPPVFRRRPPTPFSRFTGEMAEAGDQAEGLGCVEGNDTNEVGAGRSSPDFIFDLSSEDSLNLPLSRGH